METGLLFGVLLASSMGVLAAWIGFDKERSFYPVVLIVIASYYVLFAVAAGAGQALVAEILVAGIFTAVAVAGFKHHLWLVVLGLIAHGAMDSIHGALVFNPGVPSWWPAFCLTFDVTAAICLTLRLRADPSVARRLR